MADSNQKHPAHSHLEAFESVLNREPKAKPTEINQAAGTLETNLADNLVFEKSKEHEAEAIRVRLRDILGQLRNNEVRQSRKKVQGLISKITITENTGTSNQDTQSPDTQALQNGPSAKPQSTIAKLKEKIPASEHGFFDAVEKYTEDKPEARETFIQAVELGKVETSVACIADLKKRINEIVTGIKSQQEFKELIPDLLQTGLKPLKAEITKAMQNWEEAEFYVTLGLGKISKEMNQVYTILSINPQTIKDPAKRRYFIDIQKEVQTKLDEIKTKFPQQEIESKGLKDKKTKAEEIGKILHDLDDEIKFFESDILAELPPDTQTVYKNEKVVSPASSANQQNISVVSPTQAAISTPSVPVTPPANPSSGNSSPNPFNAPLGGSPNARHNRQSQNINTAQNRPTNAPNAPEKLSDDVKKMLESLLAKKALVSNESAVCLAINKLVRESRVDITQLQQFLQNPAFLNKTVSDEARHEIEEEMKNTHADSLDKLKMAFTDELADIEEFANSIKGRRPLPAEADKLQTNSERKTKIRNLSRALDLLIALEKRTMIYESPKEILALVNFFINKDKADFTMEELGKDITGQVDEQKENQYKGWGARINRACFFLKPTMSSTLRAISKDREFKKLGENPSAELEKLAKIARKPEKLRDWVEALPGGMKDNIHTTVPRVIAYMESAIREGQTSSLIKTGAARDLVENLRKLQHENARKEVEDEFRKNTSMTNQEKMLRYVTKLNDADHNIADVNLNLIKNNARNTKWIRGSAIAGGLVAPTIAPLAAFASVTVPYFAERIYKGVSEKNTPMAVKAGARVTAVNALGIGGTMIGGLYLGLPLAALGLIAPSAGKFFWKHKKGIAVGGGKMVGRTALWGLRHTPIIGRLFKK